MAHLTRTYAAVETDLVRSDVRWGTILERTPTLGVLLVSMQKE